MLFCSQRTELLSSQRTDRAPKDRNIAEVDPKKFAEMLIERLERILKEQEKTERVHKVIHEVCQPEYTLFQRRL